MTYMPHTCLVMTSLIYQDIHEMVSFYYDPHVDFNSQQFISTPHKREAELIISICTLVFVRFMEGRMRNMVVATALIAFCACHGHNTTRSHLKAFYYFETVVRLGH